MRQIFFLVLLFITTGLFAQAPANYTNINGRYRWIAGMFDSTFHIPKGSTPSLRTGGSTNAGGLFYNTSDSSVYTYTGTQWIKVRGSITPSDTTNKYVTQVYKKNGSDSVFYVKGGNHLFAFVDSVGSAGGGGGGKIYYFNGGVNMGTIGGLQMYELGDTANTGTAANFTRSTTGNIANFITDPGKPGLVQIPAGVWSVDAWLSETGGGANHAEIWVEVEKWDGSTITTIATSPIEQITEGSTPNLYSWSVSIPTTSLTVTDRIIIQFYISNTNGKTVTLYTQNGYVGEVHTTFTTGIGAINGLTAPAQYLVTGTSGTDFNISSVTATHTFNLPTASATNRGALSSADWTTFNGKVGGSGTSGQVSYFNGTNSITSSPTFAFTPTSQLLVNNSVTAASAIARGINATPTLTAAANNDVLVGLDINPTFTNGAFTGVNNFAARVQNDVRITKGGNNYIDIVANANGSQPYIDFFFSGVFATRLNSNIPLGGSYATGSGVVVTDFGLTKQNFGAKQIFASDVLEAKGNLFLSSTLGNRVQFVEAGVSNRGNIGVLNGTSYIQIRTGSASTLTDGTLSTAFFSTGNVGINTTTDAGFRLDVNGTARVQEALTLNGVSTAATILTNSNANSINIVANPTVADNQTRVEVIGSSASGGSRINYRGNLQVFTNSAAATELMRISSSGLSVNTSATILGTLTINGVSNISNILTNSNANAINLVANPTVADNQTRVEIVGSGVAGGSRINYRGNLQTFTSSTATTEYMRIVSGNVLIGTTTDAGFRLDIAGTARVSGQLNIGGYVAGSANSSSINFGASANIYLQSDGKLNIQGNAQVAIFPNGIQPITIANNVQFLYGDITIAKGAGVETTIKSSAQPLRFQSASTFNIELQASSGGVIIGGIGANLNASAKVQIESTTQGFLQPRMTTAQRDAISTPATGLSVYNTSTNTNDYYNGSAWLNVGQVLAPANNTTGFSISGSSLTGSNAQSLVSLSQTWNTTGNPTAFLLNITNTASGATADLMELQVGGVAQFIVGKSGTIQTTAPAGGTAKPWKLGNVAVVSPTSPDRTIEVEIDGVTYYIHAKTTNN